MQKAFSVLGLVRDQSYWFWVILALAVFLRFWLATYSTDANDIHLHVVNRIMATGEMLAADDCWQCYHVKAFHYPAAVLLSRLSIDNPVDQLRLLHYVNSTLGVFTILLLWAWLRPRRLAEAWKLALFALLALNPRLAAINAQVTNDSLVIFAATACFFFYARFLENKSFVNLWIAVAACALAAASKASGIVVALMFAAHLLALAFIYRARLPRLKTKVATFAVLVGISGLLVPYAGYVQNAEQTGDALSGNVVKRPFPNWMEEKRWNQAGTTSIASTYLSFPLGGLVAYPYINNAIDDINAYPRNRTSHWGQLYARFNFSRFDRWPDSWATNGYWTTRVGQAAMVLGLVPLGLLLAGLGSLVLTVAGALRNRAAFRRLLADPDVFLAMTALGMLAMSLKLSLDFQTYGIMKVIYVFPALIGILALLVRGLEALRRRVPQAALALGRRLVICLLVVHVVDLSILATDLQARYPHRVQQLAGFETLEIKENQVRLDRLAETNLVEQRGHVSINQSVSGLPLTGGYEKYQFGFGTRAPASMVFALNGDYAYFETRMALADESSSRDGVRFEIVGDGKLLYRGPFLIDNEVESTRIDVSGIDLLHLRTHELANLRSDMANWLHPVLTRK